MFSLPFIKHLLVVDYLFRDESQLVDVFFHFLLVKFFHFLEINASVVDMLEFDVVNSVVHKIFDFSKGLFFVYWLRCRTDLFRICSFKFLIGLGNAFKLFP